MRTGPRPTLAGSGTRAFLARRGVAWAAPASASIDERPASVRKIFFNLACEVACVSRVAFVLLDEGEVFRPRRELSRADAAMDSHPKAETANTSGGVAAARWLRGYVGPSPRAALVTRRVVGLNPSTPRLTAGTLDPGQSWPAPPAVLEANPLAVATPDQRPRSRGAVDFDVRRYPHPRSGSDPGEGGSVSASGWLFMAASAREGSRA